MKVLFTTAECAPFAKTGGLGDVAYALPKELKRTGVDVRVVMPNHKVIPEKYREMMEDVTSFYVQVGWRNQFCGVKKLVLDEVTYYFIDNLYYFDRDGVYGSYDDGERFGFFCQAVIEMMEKIDFIPDVVHVNDFHTAMIPVLLAEKYHWVEAYRFIETVLTIHNLKFQGIYDPSIMEEIFNMDLKLYYEGALRYDDCVNFLKGGILYAGRVTTVSPSYAREIQTPEFGEGLDAVLRSVDYKLSGIINGIDYDSNDPETDSLIPYNYTEKNLAGKMKDKKHLQERMGLPVSDEIPLIAMVSRLTPQKGCDLILREMETIMQSEIQMVVLGTGDYDIEHGFRYFASLFPQKLSVSTTFDVALAQEMYAGSDFFLMPSAFEPCGLSQMMAMRYGSLPIVHEVGGLRDSVRPYNPVTQKGTGFGFVEYAPHVLTETIFRGIGVYYDEPDVFREMIAEAMAEDFSWEKSGASYVSIYEKLKSS